MKKLTLIVSLLAISAVACTDLEEPTETTEQSLSGQEQNTYDTFIRHVTAFNAGDIDAIMEDFNSQSVLITPDGVFDTEAGIEAVFTGLLAEFGTVDNGDSPGITVDLLYQRKDTLYITWHAESINLVFPYGTDTFVVSSDKIRRQTIAFTAELK